MANSTTKFLKPDYLGMSNADPGGVLKNAHNPQKKSIDVSDIDTLVPEKWDRVEVIYDSKNNPLESKYYIDILPQKTQITTKNDVSGSLNNKYFILYSGRDQVKYYVWYNVDGAGIDPAISGGVGIEIAIQANEHRNVIAFLTQQNIDLKGDFNTELKDNILLIETKLKGLTTSSEDVNTTFTFNTLQEGKEELVRSIVLTYNNNNPIFNGQEYINYYYDVFSGKLVYDGLGRYNSVTGSEKIAVEGNLTIGDSEKTTPIIQNVNAPAPNTQYTITIPTGTKEYSIYNRGLAKVQYSFISGNTNTLFRTIHPGETLKEERVKVSSNMTIYFQTTKPDQTLEVLIWL